MQDEIGADGDARLALAAELRALNLAVHQPTDPPLFTRAPTPAMQPCHWKAADIAVWLERIGTQLELAAGGVRRTLRLTNPGLAWGTTPTIWCSIQYILPGEVATAHRHAASALRFIMQGHGANTIVDGEKYWFGEGDLVLTPAGAFHDHAHEGDKPMIWLDVLDVSLVRALDAVFFEASDVPRRPLNNAPDRGAREYASGIMGPLRPSAPLFDNPIMAYPWKDAEAAVMAAGQLPPDPFVDTALEYRNPRTAGPALPTIGTVLQRLRPGADLRPFRQTGSAVFHVVRGQGVSQISDQRFAWGAGDFFAVPSWAVQQHANPFGEDAILFQVSDAPALKALGMWREEPA